MTREAAAFLGKAQKLLDRAPALLQQGFTDDAGRTAYFAGYHAGQALLFEDVGGHPNPTAACKPNSRVWRKPNRRSTMN